MSTSNNNPLGYGPGDRVYIFETNNWGLNRFSSAVVRKVTPTGRLRLQYLNTASEPCDIFADFKPNGKKLGDGTWRGPWLLPKDQQEAEAASLRAAHKAVRTQQEFQKRCEALAKQTLNGDRPAILAELAAMIQEYTLS